MSCNLRCESHTEAQVAVLIAHKVVNSARSSRITGNRQIQVSITPTITYRAGGVAGGCGARAEARKQMAWSEQTLKWSTGLAFVALALSTTACATDDDPAPSATPTIAADVASNDATSATVTATLAATTIVPGNINETVPNGTQQVAAPVDIDEPATIEGRLTASIIGVESIETEANVPGEIAGPGVIVTIEVRNDSDQTIDLNSVVVDLIGGDGVSATPILAGTTPVGGALAAGAAASGTYVFNIEEALRRDVTIQLNYAADVPVIVFTGDLH
jgi:hypothetical protein